MEAGRELIAAAEAASNNPNDPSLRDRLNQASAGVAAAVRSLLFIHQQQPQQQQAQPVSAAASADEAARAEIMRSAQVLIAAATQLHEAATSPSGRSSKPTPAGVPPGLDDLPRALIPPAQHIAGAAGPLPLPGQLSSNRVL